MRKLRAFFIMCLSLICTTLYAQDNRLIKINMIPLPDNRVRIDFCFEAPINSTPTSFVTENPQRLIFDFVQTKLTIPNKERIKKTKVGVIDQYQIIGVNGRVRVLIDINRSTYFTSQVLGNVYSVIIAGKRSEVFAQPKPIHVTHRPIFTKYKICNLTFRGVDNQSGRVIFDVNSASLPVDVVQTGKEIKLTFLSTEIPEYLMKRFDLADFHTPAQLITTYQDGNKAVIKIINQGDYGFFSYQVNKQFMVDVYPLSAREAQALKLKKQIFTGQRISLNFQDISIRAVLQILADFTHTNMVVSDSVSGNITLRLDDVPWDQALNIILRSRSLDKRQVGNVTMIAPSAEIAAREKQEYDAAEEVQDSSPLRSDIIQVNYAKADDLANLLKGKSNSVLSKRGKLNVDSRTNTIWIQDTGLKIEEVRELFKKLDVPVKQVLIETRIVEVTRDVALDLGIEWGISRPEHLSGTLRAANELAKGKAPAEVTPISDRLNVDLGAAPAIGQAASIGLAVANLGSNILLDLELSALESENKAEVIASPRVVTSDQQEAYISSGEQIPYQQATSSGATAVSFVQAVLSLKVTPQITPDGRIMMKLKINQDRASQTLYNGVPAIITKEIDTNVLVDNGETIVLGGIFQRNQGNDVTRVPFFGTLPVVGILFKRTHANEKNEELLIFITPKIITDALSIGAIDGKQATIDVYK